MHPVGYEQGNIQIYTNHTKNSLLTHIWRRWGTTQDFYFQNLLMNLKNKYLLKSCWSELTKNKIILIFTMLHFFKKIKKNTWRYQYQNLNNMIYSSWDIDQNRLKLVILGLFCLFNPLKTSKIKLLKK